MTVEHTTTLQPRVDVLAAAATIPDDQFTEAVREELLALAVQNYSQEVENETTASEKQALIEGHQSAMDALRQERDSAQKAAQIRKVTVAKIAVLICSKDVRKYPGRHMARERFAEALGISSTSAYHYINMGRALVVTGLWDADAKRLPEQIEAVNRAALDTPNQDHLRPVPKVNARTGEVVTDKGGDVVLVLPPKPAEEEKEAKPLGFGTLANRISKMDEQGADAGFKGTASDKARALEALGRLLRHVEQFQPTESEPEPSATK